ncbi:anthranilate phosphoribosyltransferase [Thalassotalea maritima]|uniref:anthranilate phosphoribosyltransferase n=1 Tax=Thalassotalea maritima TaxID=3242416 RepID=UPI003527A7DB
MNRLQRVIEGQSLNQQQSYQLFEQLLAGELEPSMIAGLLTAMRIKGETPEEIAGAALAVRHAAKPFPEHSHTLVDCVGTGGDGHHTINISTTAAIVAGACGLHVAKHGNRNVSSKSGSADLLEALGVNLTMSPETALDCLNSAGICFLFAPHYHAAFKHVAPIRKQLGVRTIFNILGPLVNPAAPQVMLVGVYDKSLLKPMAQALRLTGVQRAWVVYGAGLDEIAIHDSTDIIEIKDGQLYEKRLQPSDVGLPSYPLSAIKGGDPQQNAKDCMAVLEGKGQAAHRDAVLINSAALLYLANKASNLIDAIELARHVLRTGKAAQCLRTLAEVSHG